MNHPVVLIASLLLLLALEGCSVVGPNYTKHEPALPQAFSSQGGKAQMQSQWWETLGDAQLNELVARALRDSPDLEIAAARLRQARANQGIQEAAGKPALNASGKVMADKLSENSENFANVPIKNVRTEFTNHQIGFDASWEIDLFGRQQRIAEAASARSEASEERLQDVRTVLAAEVARNYVEFRATQQRQALAIRTLRDYEEILRLVRLTAKAGEATQLDVQRAAASRDNYAATLPPLALNARQSIAALSILTTMSLTELEAQLGAPTALMPVPEAPAAGLPSDLLKRRPDLRAAERDLAAANADVGVAIAEQYPRFSLIGSAGWSSIQADSLLNTASTLWSVGPQLSLPLFNSGRLKNQVKANEAAFAAMQASYRKAVLAAVSDAEVALTRMAQNEARRQQLLDAEAQQARLLALTERQQKAGEVTKIVMLESRKALANQQDQTLQAHAQSITALIGLYKVLGGGWQ